jgi:oxalate decarboxylase/phosphoglucose isomerase-like protein (cupin superfamily)
MELLNKMNGSELKHEYGLDGKRLLPWNGLNAPYGGAYCIVRKGTRSLSHINEPLGEAELFIGISGVGKVWVGQTSYEVQKGDTLFIPPGTTHYVENESAEDFHFYAIWWDIGSATSYIKTMMNHE